MDQKAGEFQRLTPGNRACPRQGLEDGPGSWHSGHFPVSLGSLDALASLPASLLSDNSESRDKKMKLTLYLEAASYNMISFLSSLHYMSGEGDSQNSKYMPKITELPSGGHRIQRLTEPLPCPFLDATSRSPEVPRLLRNQVATSGEGRTLRL